MPFEPPFDELDDDIRFGSQACAEGAALAAVLGKLREETSRALAEGLESETGDESRERMPIERGEEEGMGRVR